MVFSPGLAKRFKRAPVNLCTAQSNLLPILHPRYRYPLSQNNVVAGSSTYFVKL